MASPARRTLLVVDDESRILSALRRSLRREGYEILTAETVPEALALLDAHAVDAILSDQKMPGMSGLEFLARAMQRAPGATCMLLTGWPAQIPRSEMEKVGVRALIPKPWDDAALKETLRRALT